jgi:hypothetical protein
MERRMRLPRTLSPDPDDLAYVLCRVRARLHGLITKGTPLCMLDDLVANNGMHW